MSQQVASLYAEIGAKIDGFQKGSSAVKGDLKDLAGAFGVQIPAMISPMALLGGAIVGVGAALYGMEKAADAAARGDARLEAVLKSTGEAAGYNFEQLDTMANSLSKVTGIDDDLIKKSMAVQATFTNISGEVFPAATKAALDLAAVLGSDLQGATIQVDKALNDFSGYTALKRAGVSFSETQIDQIKNFKETNNLAGYQKLVLAELTKEFGGAAAAIHNAGDKSEDLEIAWGNLTEEAGGGLVPALRGVNVYLAESINGWNAFFQGLNRGDTAISQFINTAGDLAVNLLAPVKILQTISDWGNQMDADNTLASTMTAAAAATDTATQSNLEYVPSAEEVEAANKAISEVNAEMIDLIQSIQDAEEKYTEQSLSLADDRWKAQARVNELQEQGFDLQSQEMQDALVDLHNIQQQEADLAEARDKQFLQFMSNILQEQLARDGWTTSEFEAFAAQQEAWGLWSAETVARAKEVWGEVDQITNSIHNIPVDTVVTITTQHIDTYGDGLIGPPAPDDFAGNPPSGLRPPPPDNSGNWIYANNQWVPWNPANWAGGGGGSNGLFPAPFPHSSGGSFMIPMSYGNEGFRMGNGDTASGGEIVTITPRGGQAGQNFDYDRMAKSVAIAVRDGLLASGIGR